MLFQENQNLSLSKVSRLTITQLVSPSRPLVAIGQRVRDDAVLLG
jgi:hypothetical protein